MKGSSRHIPQLDGVRGIAVLMVLVWHSFAGQLVAERGTIWSNFRTAFGLWWSGVDLFFVLSGFLIVGILLDHRADNNYFAAFYARRSCRIFPLYFLLLFSFTVAVAAFGQRAAFHWLLHDPLPAWSYATFTQNLPMAQRGDFGPHWLSVTWSLAVEEQFYLLMPLLIHLCPRRAVLAVMAGLLVVAPLMRTAMPGFQAFVGAPWRADSIMAGGCLAVLVRRPDFCHRLQQHPGVLWTAFLILLTGAAALTLRPHLLGAFNHTWLAALYATFVLLAYLDETGILNRVLCSRPLLWLGTLSYGIYLIHVPMAGLMHAMVRGRSPEIHNLTDAGLTAVSLAVTFLLASASYRWYEKPFLRLGQTVPYTTRPAAPAYPAPAIDEAVVAA